MAYGTKYFFRWVSDNGTEYRVELAQDGYTGTAVQRRLGQAPVLRRDKNDRIWGSSLELFVECQQDQEFAELYTGSAFEWQVNLILMQVVSGQTVPTAVWRGFVSPELYSEPDIAPPYDVQIIATDGIGELKFRDFYHTAVAADTTGDSSATPETLQSVIHHCLKQTGLDFIALLAPYSLSALTFREGTGTTDKHLPVYALDLHSWEYYDGKTCYEVLTDILTLLHAVCFRHDMRWWIVRETDLEVEDDLLQNVRTWAGAYVDGPTPPECGQRGTTGWWPVGYLSTTVEPARKRVEVANDLEYRRNMQDGLASFVDGSWTRQGTTSEYTITNAGADPLPGLYLGSVVEQGQVIRYYQGSVESAPFYMRGGTISGQVEISIRYSRFPRVDVDGNRIPAYLLVTVQRGDEYLHKAQEGERTSKEYYWSPVEGSIELETNIPPIINAPLRGRSSTAEIGFTFETDPTEDPYIITIENKPGFADVWVGEFRIFDPGSIRNRGAVVDINNGAREDESVELAVNSSPDAYEFEVFENVLKGHTGMVTRVGCPRFYANRFLEFVAMDYAVSHALPRLRVTGVLNVPKDETPPLAFMKSGNLYLLETYEWDLLHDELTVDMLSAPAVDIDTASFTITSLED